MSIMFNQIWINEGILPIYIKIYIYVCVCVCVWSGSSRSFKRVSLNNKDKFCLYNLFKILSSFLISVLNFRLELKDEFPKIVQAFSYPS